MWEHSHAPYRDYRACWDIVKDCINTWTNAKKRQKMDSKYQAELNSILDFRPPHLKTLSSLKAYMKSKDKKNWSDDYEFFKGQLKHPQEKTMSNQTDNVLAQCIQKRDERAAKTASFLEKNKGESSVIDSADKKPQCSKTMVSKENIIEKIKVTMFHSRSNAKR